MKRCFRVWLLSIYLVVIVTGCAIWGDSALAYSINSNQTKFYEKIDSLLENQVKQVRSTVNHKTMVYVMPGSIVNHMHSSRLEEIICKRLSLKLMNKYSEIKLTRQIYMNLMGKNSSELAHDDTYGSDGYGLFVIFKIDLFPDYIKEMICLTVSVLDHFGRVIPELNVEEGFDFSSDGFLNELYQSEPDDNPYPYGSEENPYTSLDKLVAGLSDELDEAYKKGVKVLDQEVSQQEIRVILSSGASNGIPENEIETIRDSLQQEIVTRNGFISSISRDDYEKIFQQISFYQKNKDTVFEMEEELLNAATVILILDVREHPNNEKVSVSLRSIWRVGPLISSNYELIPTNYTGTYISGFTAKAYIDAEALMPIDNLTNHYDLKHMKKKVSVYENETDIKKLHSINGVSFESDLTEKAINEGKIEICFKKFRRSYEPMLYQSLMKTTPIQNVTKNYAPCATSEACSCYIVTYVGTYDELSGYLKNAAMASDLTGFDLKPLSETKLDIVFGYGFE